MCAETWGYSCVSGPPVTGQKSGNESAPPVHNLGQDGGGDFDATMESLR
jgi:hypothetical protein